MINVRKLSAFLLLVCASLFVTPAHAQLQVVGDGGPGPVKAQHLTAELVSLSPDIAPGGTLQVGLVLTLEEHWHVYWINAGDSGEPPKITWTLPEGITAGPMLFPIPSRLPLGPLMDFGYEDEVAFPVQLTAASSLKPGPTHIDAKVTYLVCREVCIPGKAHLGLNLNVVPGAPAAQPVGALGEALGLIPKPLPPDAKLSVTGGKTDFVLNLITGGRETNAEFYPADQDQIANAAPQPIEPTSDGVRLRVRRSDDLKTLPAQLHGVLKLSDNEAYEVTAPVTPGEVAPAPVLIIGFREGRALAVGAARIGEQHDIAVRGEHGGVVIPVAVEAVLLLLLHAAGADVLRRLLPYLQGDEVVDQQITGAVRSRRKLSREWRGARKVQYGAVEVVGILLGGA